MIHIHGVGHGAVSLSRWLATNGAEVARTRNGVGSAPTRFHIGDLLVNWGRAYRRPVPDNVRVLNPKIIGNKLRELVALDLRGLPIPGYSQVAIPGWLARSLHHTGGNDLLNPPRQPSYWTQKLDITTEYRFHIFRGQSIRAGIKQPIPGVASHIWIRSYDAGWGLCYNVATRDIPKEARRLAKRAVEALRYDFGAVDIGMVAGAGPVVLEVNSAPGLEGNTLSAYGQAILGMANNGGREDG